MRYWLKDNPIDQWNKLKSPKTDPHLYANLVYDPISGERMDFPIKRTRTIGYSYGGKDP